MAYQLPGFALLLSSVVGGIVILAFPRDRLWGVTSVIAAAVTAGMVISYISLSV